MEDEEFKYATPVSDSFSIHLGGRVVSAKNKVITLSRAESDELRKLLQSGRPDIAQNMVLIDTKAAEELVRKDVLARSAKPQAISGAVPAPAKPSVIAGGVVKPVDVPIPAGTSSRLAAMLKGNGDHVRAVGEVEHPVIEKVNIEPVEETAFHNEDTANIPPKSE